MEKQPKSRTSRFAAGLISGYAALAFNIAYTLASIPLALRYLSKEEFGLWSLITQLSGYLMLLELGMSGSITRHLSVYKDDVNGGRYGSVLMTGFYIFLVQSILIILIGILLVMSVPHWTDVPRHLVGSFYIVGFSQILIGALALALRSFGSALWPHQRLDIHNLGSMANLAGSFIVLWLGFKCGWGIFSLAASSATGFVISQVIILTACHRLRYFPKRGCWGGYDKALFREMFHFGSGLFILNLGTQLVSASQTIVISRTLGLENTSVWTVATKLSSMMQLFVNRIFETSAAGLLEMKVRGETVTLRRRSGDLITLACSLAGFGAVGLAFFNSAFLEIWTRGSIKWSPVNDYLLGVVVLATCASRFHTGIASLGKEVHKVKYVCLLEGVVFITLSFLLAPKCGLSGILVSSIVSGLFVNLATTLSINSRGIGVSYGEALGWMIRPWLLTPVFMLLHFIVFPHDAGAPLVFWKRLLPLMAFIMFVVPAYYYLGIPTPLKRELGQMFSRMTSGFRARWFSTP